MSKKGELKLELAPPFTDKLSKLHEFVDDNDLMGQLDRRYLTQIFNEFATASLTKYVSKFKAQVVRKKRKVTWVLCMTVNSKKDFQGEGPEFADAFLQMMESFESFIAKYELN